MESVRDLLKTGTADHHRVIEKQLDFMNPNRDEAAYANMIERFFVFYDNVETKLNELPFMPAALEWPRRQKSPLLARDLEALDLCERDFENRLSPELPPIRNKAELLGMLYVLEGSTLGSQVLSAHFSRLLGIGPENGGAYFHGYGAETGRMWRQFIGVLESEIKTPEEAQAALATAQATFESMGAWMTDQKTDQKTDQRTDQRTVQTPQFETV